ncbi:Sulfhydryl oxidase 2, partial [Stegodyphus mimosarum]
MNFLFVCTFVVIATISVYVSPVFSASLYSPDDPLWELDTTNFKRVILNKSNIWIVEFYNNWCGHCVRFAPTWKAFARDTRTWRNVVDVAVVNCAESQNVNLCRDYDINGFPTIKLFKAYANETELGEALTGNRDINSMEISIINFLEAHWNDKGKWP